MTARPSRPTTSPSRSTRSTIRRSRTARSTCSPSAASRIATEVVDAQTIRFRLAAPFAPLLNSIGFGVLPKHLLGAALAAGTFAQQWGIDTPPEQLVGTGPYRMTRYVPAQYLQYARNPDYWMRDEQGGALPRLPEQTILIVPDQNTIYLKFLDGQMHYYAPRPEEVADVRARAERLGVTLERHRPRHRHAVRELQPQPRTLRAERPPRSAPRLVHRSRSSCAPSPTASTRKSMILNVYFGYGEPAVASISPGEQGLPQPQRSSRYPYDLERARAPAHRGRLRRPRRGRRPRGRARQPDRVRPLDQRRQPGARALVLDPEGGLDHARHQGELPAARVRDPGREAHGQLRLGRDGDGLHRRGRAAQRRQPAALLGATCTCGTRTRSVRRRRGRRRSIASSISARASSTSRSRQAALLADPGDPPSRAAADPARAARAVRRRPSRTLDGLRLDGLGVAPAGADRHPRPDARLPHPAPRPDDPAAGRDHLRLVRRGGSRARRLLHRAAHESVDLAATWSARWRWSSATASRCRCATAAGSGASCTSTSACRSRTGWRCSS